jgi:hypothetical protein
MSKFQPGQSGNPNGRRPGCRNRFNEAFINDLYADWQQHGVEVIEKVRTEHPQIYLRVCASVQPRDVHIRTESLEQGMSDEEFNYVLGEIRRSRLARAGSADGAGSEAPSSGGKLN